MNQLSAPPPVQVVYKNRLMSAHLIPQQTSQLQKTHLILSLDFDTHLFDRHKNSAKCRPSSKGPMSAQDSEAKVPNSALRMPRWNNPTTFSTVSLLLNPQYKSSSAVLTVGTSEKIWENTCTTDFYLAVILAAVDVKNGTKCMFLVSTQDSHAEI